jgi:hypothetical protein
MAYLDEVTGTVYDGNFKIKDGERTRIRTTYRIRITVNDEHLFEGFTNQETKKDALNFALESVHRFYADYNKLINVDFDENDFSFKTKFTIKAVADKPYVEGDFKKLKI